MTVCITKGDGVISLMVRAEGDGALGDLVRVVRPGESALGKTYEEWAAVTTPTLEVH